MIELFKGKPLREVNEADLNALVKEKIRENRFLEYKEAAYGRKDSEIEEMLNDITSMANASGGYLIIGISEDRSADDGTPLSLVGIEDGDNQATRIESSCLSNIDERIQGLEIKDVPLANGKSAIVIRIPNSIRKPHMITFKGKNRFWIRHERQKQKMNVEEVRDTILKVEDYMRKLETFLEKRKQEILEEINDAFWMVLSSTPVFVGEEKIDVFSSELEILMKNPPVAVQGIRRSISSGMPHPTLYGVRAEEMHQYTETGRGQYLEVYRNGHVEFGLSLQHFHEKGSLPIKTYCIPSTYAAEYVISFLSCVKKINEIFKVTEPIVLKMNFYNAKDVYLHYWSSPIDQPDEIFYWKIEHLEIPPMQLFSIDNPERVSQMLCDRLYNAFGLKKSRNFDDAGKFIPRL